MQETTHACPMESGRISFSLIVGLGLLLTELVRLCGPPLNVPLQGKVSLGMIVISDPSVHKVEYRGWRNYHGLSGYCTLKHTCIYSSIFFRQLLRVICRLLVSYYRAVWTNSKVRGWGLGRGQSYKMACVQILHILYNIFKEKWVHGPTALRPCSRRPCIMWNTWLGGWSIPPGIYHTHMCSQYLDQPVSSCKPLTSAFPALVCTMVSISFSAVSYGFGFKSNRCHIVT